MPTEYVPRVSIEVPPDLYDRFTNLVAWGLRSKVLVPLIEDLCECIEQNGEVVLAAILKRSINVSHIMKGVNKGGA